MKEYIPAFILVLLFTLVYSCSDHKKQKRVNKDIEATYNRIKDAHENLLIVHDTLEAALEELKREQEVFAENLDAGYDSLWKEHLQQVESHGHLTDSVKALLEKAQELDPQDESEGVREEIKKLNAQVAGYIRTNEKILQTHARFKRLHNEQLHGQRTDVH